MNAVDRFRGRFGWLSNFYPWPVSMAGLEFPSVEHAYQAAKTLDDSERDRIRRCDTPGRAKRMGRAVHIRSDWESIKVGVMHDLLIQKFEPLDGLGAELLSTGDAELIEGNDWGDTFWGCVYTASGQRVGQNHLGKLLMKVRRSIRPESWEHTEWRCTLGSDKCNQCNYDTHSELFLCAVCGGCEGSLPTSCPGRHMARFEKELTYRGKLNFVDGYWMKSHFLSGVRCWSLL